MSLWIRYGVLVTLTLPSALRPLGALPLPSRERVSYGRSALFSLSLGGEREGPIARRWEGEGEEKGPYSMPTGRRQPPVTLM